MSPQHGGALAELTVAPSLTSYEAVLQFQAPYLVEKLVKDHIADSVEEAEVLFAEAKKFLIMSHAEPDVLWNMYSSRVDEAWHQFVLFTRQYVDFCQRYFGKYLHHNPSNAPDVPESEGSVPSTAEAFRDRYESFFGERLPEVWLDHRSVRLSRRIINDNAGRSQVTVDAGMVRLAGPAGKVEVDVNDIALEAMKFISRTGSFYVRELPGELTDDEKIGLVSTLVEHHVLRVL